MEERKNSLGKFKARVATESLTKSIIFGVIGGVLTMALLALVLFLCDARILNWLCVLIILVVGAGAGAGFFVLFAKKVFITKDKAVADRVDGLGFDERAVTMVEFSGDDSVMAQKQREDTNEKLEQMDEKQVKFRVPKLAIVLLAVVAICCIPAFATLPNVMASSDEIRVNQIIKEAISEIRQDIDQTKMPQDTKDELHEILDNLWQDVKDTHDIEEKKELLEKAKNDINNVLDYYKQESEQIIQDMLEDLEEVVDNADVSESTREELDKIVEDLKTELDKITDSVIKGEITEQEGHNQKIDKIEEAAGKIDEEIKKDQEAVEDIVENIQQEADKVTNQEVSDALKDLASAIQSGNSQKAEDALGKLNDALQKEETKESLDESLKEVVDVIEGAIKDAPESSLKTEMGNLAGALNQATQKETLESEKPAVDSAIKDAQTAIGDALKNEEEKKETQGSMSEIMKDTADKLGQNPPIEPGTMEGITDVIEGAKEEIDKILGNSGGSNSGSGSNSGINHSGIGSGSGSMGLTAGSNMGSGGLSGNSHWSAGSNSGSMGLTAGSNSGSGSIKGSNSGSGSNPGSSSGSGSGDGSGIGSVESEPKPPVYDGSEYTWEKYEQALALYEQMLLSGEYDEETLNQQKDYIEAMEAMLGIK